jgi:EAL domain-containing protein (putative c-di-GMP-specific phosphodiesterase class I)
MINNLFNGESLNGFDVREIIRQESIITRFQPIVSLKEKRVVGIEALSRGILPSCGTIVSPVELFAEAKNCCCLVELDRLCRKKAIQNFKHITDHKDLILFLNLEASILDQVENDKTSWTKVFADEAGVDCGMVAIEIVESRIEKNDNLVKFVDKHKELGFFVTLDDFGALHSNLDRIVRSKPHIIKIDRSLIANIANDYYQQSIVRSIIELSKKIGSLTLAEGLEMAEDVITCYELGTDLFQGFFFAEPLSVEETINKCCFEEIERISLEIKSHLNGIVTRKQLQHKHYEAILDEIIEEIRDVEISDRKVFLDGMITRRPEIERIYLLNNEGIQVAEAANRSYFRKNGRHSLYWPKTESIDHSLKDYFYFLMRLDITKYYTDPFMSLASGRLCRTLSCRFTKNSREEVVCIDFLDSSENIGEIK